MINWSLTEAARAVREGRISAAELVAATLKQIGDNKYNAFLSVCADEAMAAARAIDNGEKTGLLCGVPIAIKDNIMVKGLPVTCGSKALENNIASRDALVVQRLREEGAIIIGKTNMDEMAMGSSNTTSAFGRVLNPLDASRVPGGSSGGSAAAVAAFQAFAALGSDTGGSIRQPASYCGIYGLKPTLGSVSSDGMYHLAPSFDQIGPLTRTAGDCEAVYSVITGGIPSVLLPADGVTIGVIKELEPVMAGSAAGRAFEAACARLEERGCRFAEVSVPAFGEGGHIYTVLASIEAAQSLREFEGGRDLFGAEVKKRIYQGGDFVGKPEFIQEACALREKLMSQMSVALAGCSCLLAPSAPSVAFRFDDDFSRKDIVLSDFYTQPASLTGYPALGVPFYKENGLPVGVQLIGPMCGEAVLFRVASLFDRD